MEKRKPKYTVWVKTRDGALVAVETHACPDTASRAAAALRASPLVVLEANEDVPNYPAIFVTGSEIDPATGQLVRR